MVVLVVGVRGSGNKGGILLVVEVVVVVVVVVVVEVVAFCYFPLNDPYL